MSGLTDRPCLRCGVTEYDANILGIKCSRNFDQPARRHMYVIRQLPGTTIRRQPDLRLPGSPGQYLATDP